MALSNKNSKIPFFPFQFPLLNHQKLIKRRVSIEKMMIISSSSIITAHSHTQRSESSSDHVKMNKKKKTIALCITFSWTLNSVLPKKKNYKWETRRRRKETKQSSSENKIKQEKKIIKKILNGFSCTWEFRYTKFNNKQGHEIEHKRDVKRNWEEKQKRQKRMSWMLEESLLLKPTRRIKFFSLSLARTQCCAMRCMSLCFLDDNGGKGNVRRGEESCLLWRATGNCYWSLFSLSQVYVWLVKFIDKKVFKGWKSVIC